HREHLLRDSESQAIDPPGSARCVGFSSSPLRLAHRVSTMGVSYQDPNDTQAAMNAATNTVVSDLNSNNFLGAWNTAESTDKYFGTPTNDAATKDPLLQLMESSSGLQALDPTKNWNAQTNAQYYSALGQSQGYTGANDLGKNPYGLWGSGAATQNGTDSRANVAQAGATPDVERFAGAKPTTSFLGKYGADIAMVALAIAAPEAAGALVGAMDTALSATATGGALLGSAATGVAESALAGGIVGAGSGALMGELTGGNVGKDALLGAVGGGVAG